MTQPQESRLGRIVLQVLLAAAILSAVVPWSPRLPDPKADPSWMLGINEAVERGLMFGRDIVFTCGPYAAVHTRFYTPGTDTLMLAGGLLIGIPYAAAFLMLMRRSRPGWIAAAVLVFAFLMHSRDALLLTYPLLFAILLHDPLLRGEETSADRHHPGRLALLLLIGLQVPLALLPLVKGSYLVYAVFVVGASAGVLLFERRHAQVASLLATPILCVVLWLAAGQPWTALPPFLGSLVPIISGFGDAMWVKGSSLDILLYLAGATGILLGNIMRAEDSRTPRIYRSVVLAAYLFLVFKAAFVRHDAHAYVAFTALLLAVLVVGSLQPLKRFRWGMGYAVLALTVFTWKAAAHEHVRARLLGPDAVTHQRLAPEQKSIRHILRTLGPGDYGRFLQLVVIAPLRQAPRPLADIVTGTWRRWLQPGGLAAEYSNTMREIDAKSGFPRLDGTSDVLSYRQTELIAAGNTWHPRPVFQSYSVYTPALVRLNVRHFLGSDAPDNVFVTIQPIDARLPALEDGPLWPILRRDYQVLSHRSDLVVLRRRPEQAAAPSSFPDGRSVTAELARAGEWIKLPQIDGRLYARVDLSRPALGRMVAAAFRPADVHMQLSLRDGTKRRLRFIPSMARVPFLLSPLVEDTTGFSEIVMGTAPAPESLAVESIRLEYEPGAASWSDSFHVTFMDETHALDLIAER